MGRCVDPFQLMTMEGTFLLKELFPVTLVAFVRFFYRSYIKDTNRIVRQDIKKNGKPAGNTEPAMSAFKDFNIPCGPGIDECYDMFFHKPSVWFLQTVHVLQGFFIDKNLHGDPGLRIILAISGSDSIGTYFASRDRLSRYSMNSSRLRSLMTRSITSPTRSPGLLRLNRVCFISSETMTLSVNAGFCMSDHVGKVLDIWDNNFGD